MLKWLWGDTPRPRVEKSQQDGRHWSGDCAALEPLWGDTPRPKAKEKPQKDGRRGEIAFRNRPHTHQRGSEDSNKPSAHQDPRTPKRLKQNSVSCGGKGQNWPATGAGVLGAADLLMAYALLEEVTINPTIESPELTQDWGNRLLEGRNRTLCAPGPSRKEYWPTRDWPRLAHECLGVYGEGLGQWWPSTGLGELSIAVPAWDLPKEVTIIFITSAMVSVPFSHSVVSDSLRPHGLQHARLPVDHELLEFTQTHVQ